MHKKLVVLGGIMIFSLLSVTMCAAAAAAKTKTPKANLSPVEAVKAATKKGGMYVVFDTTMGRIICELYPDKAPIGVDSFVGLAEGTKEFTDPKTGKKEKKHYFDGLIFHRVIPNFMIQGGDPLGKGYGGPGYQFKNEVHKDLLFDKPGRLAYANAGPDTNGSQFFITHNATPNLNGGYTIFGQCISGQDIVTAIGSVPRDPGDRPLTPVVMNKVTIVRYDGAKKKSK